MRRDLPTGTVTFVFTDIEGSTRMLDELGPERYGELLSRHHRVCRAAWVEHGGVEVDTAGDAFFVAFPTASGALRAAGEAQEALDELGLRVRMGVHTGEVSVGETGYVGFEVHRAARIASAAHGGQVVVSASTAALIGANGLVDLGEHRFKDLAAAERVFQLGEESFPALKSLHRSNLPVPATPFVGRGRELADVVELLTRSDTRLVTLTGPGGTGKTRLALQAAADAADGFPDGVWWVPLAPLRDPALVLPAVAQALEIRERPDEPLHAVLAERLGGARMVIVVDNAEHLLPALAEDVVRLLDVDGPRLMLTSRERLQVQAERLYDVPPLAADDAVTLFVTRARALGVALEAAPSVEALCRRLEDLPLAIELAAARTRVFSVEQLLERLGQRLDLLKAGRDADPRQQTLRATIEWSYDLLDTEEQRLLRALSVFAGGCTFEAADAVCGADPDSLQSLIDKSLVRVRADDAGGTRYWMLETIREYAAERLDRLDEAGAVRSRHGEWIVQLVDGLAVPLRRLEPSAVLLIRPEHDNIRAAVRWSLGGGDVPVATRLLARLCVYWIMTGVATEGRATAELVLAVPGLSAQQRLEVLVGASELLRFTGELLRAIALKEEALELLHGLGEGQITGPVPMSRDDAIIAFLKDLAQTHAMAGNIGAAETCSDEALDRALSFGAPLTVAHARFAKAIVEFFAGRYPAAREHMIAALPTWEEESHLSEVALTHLMLGECRRRERRPDDALREMRLGLDLALDAGDMSIVYEAFQELAGLASMRDQPDVAGRLLGASDRLLGELGIARWSPADVAQTTAALRSAVGDDQLETLREVGATLTIDAAVELAHSID